MKLQKLQFTVIGAVLISLQFLVSDSLAQVSFSPLTNFSTGSGPISIAKGDFNGDGEIDLATANGQATAGGNSVSVLIGDGMGSFASPINFGNTVSSNFIVTADFNVDGDLDIATTDAGQNMVSVFQGNGDGTFGSSVSFSIGNNPISLVAADFNGDGKADIATANSGGSGSVSILLNNGSGSFGTASTLTAGYVPYSLTSADFNGDNIADLAVACQDITNNVSIFLGTGSGTFGSATNLTVSGYPHSIINDDFNMDGISDLAIGYHYNSSNKVLVLKGNGTGGFTAATPTSVNSDPYTLTSADINSDGKTDVAVTARYDNSVSVYIGDGTGNFGTATIFSLGLDPWSITNADMNGDGNIDLAVTNYIDNNISILLNNTPPPVSPICLVTVDSTNTHNLIIWEKGNLNLAAIDSFVVYREINTNNYQRIGAVFKDSLSVFDDFAANPANTGYRYKLKSKNALGVESPFSNYHNTMYLVNNGANFSWTSYQIENNSNPVSAYNVYRDDLTTGNFLLIGNTSGNQFGYTDINFSSFPNSSYYVEAVMNNGACTPTRSSFYGSRSNIKNFGTTEVNPLKSDLTINIYPNPANNTMNITGASVNTKLYVYDVVGKLVLEKEVINNNAIDISFLTEGVYTVITKNQTFGRTFNKVVISR
ncbi:MAG: FG-GAP-like repeat-containing protein [Bacteroidota bacterium]